MTTEYLVIGAADGEVCTHCDNLKTWLRNNDVKFRELKRTDSEAMQYRPMSIPKSIRLINGAYDNQMTGNQPAEAKQFFGV